MLKTSIQSTAIRAGRIEIFIADAEMAEHATTWVRFSVPADADPKRPIAHAQLEGLRAARDTIGAEIAMIEETARPKA